ncbi:MAG: tRNA (adenosine(37)-N6)-threonylcarbamoyltransferase complex ATPase subunit type 1 TsaE [Amphiplicatus sp.]
MLNAAFHLRDAGATLALGGRLAPLLRPGDVVGLSGPLGAGKTSLARGIIGALFPGEEAPSPTFALVETYEAAGLALWHFDLYRLEKAGDVFELGLEAALAEGASLIEWPERIASHIPDDALLIRLRPEGGGRRAIATGGGAWARRFEESGLLRGRESNDKD